MLSAATGLSAANEQQQDRHLERTTRRPDAASTLSSCSQHSAQLTILLAEALSCEHHVHLATAGKQQAKNNPMSSSSHTSTEQQTQDCRRPQEKPRLENLDSICCTCSETCKPMGVRSIIDHVAASACTVPTHTTCLPQRQPAATQLTLARSQRATPSTQSLQSPQTDTTHPGTMRPL